MSYILKALRKSEAERAKGTIPRLTTRHDPEPPSRRKLWPALAAGTLLANLGLVALVLWQPNLLPGQWGGDEPTGGAQAEIAPAATAQPAAVSATERQVASLEEAAGEDPAQDPAEAQPEPDDIARRQEPQAIAPAVLEPAAAPLSDPTPEPAADVPLEPKTPAPAVKQVAAEPVAAEPVTSKPVTAEPATSKPVTLGEFLTEETVTEPAAREETVAEEQATAAQVPPRPKEKPALRALIAKRAVEDKAAQDRDGAQPARDQLAWAVPVPDAPEPPPVPEPPDPFADVPELWRLSQAFRQSVPEMTISVHVYSPERGRRFIIIDRHKYLEGDRLNGGVLLEAILPQGVVFTLNGQQFKLTSG